ncbi:MAG: threonine/serine dehydratase [Candidatus Bathyarchaeia archaeon]
MITLDDVRAARESIKSLIKRTPLKHSRFLSDLCGGEVYLKLENLQVTCSFKIRGALNKLLNLSAKERKRGVITASAGNHGLAVAFAAKKLGIRAKIILPMNTPKVKVDKIKRYDVELVSHGKIYDEAEREAIELAKREGLTYISPYNDWWVIAGQGTVGLEILEDLPNVDVVIVPVGGGGLISGIGVAVKSVKPSMKVLGVQSEASAVMYESLKAGRIIDVEMRESVADGLFGGVEKGSVTFEMIQRYVDDLILVKEETIKKAIYLLWNKERQVVEGSGAAAIAPMLEKPNLFEGKTVAAVISGGNIEGQLFQDILTWARSHLS